MICCKLWPLLEFMNVKREGWSGLCLSSRWPRDSGEPTLTLRPGISWCPSLSYQCAIILTPLHASKSNAALLFVLQACGFRAVHNHWIPHSYAKWLLMPCWTVIMFILWCFYHKMLVVWFLGCKEAYFIFHLFEWAALGRNMKTFQNKSPGIF